MKANRDFKLGLLHFVHLPVNVVHLHGLAEVDSGISSKEARFLMYSLKLTQIDFEDVILKTTLARANKHKES